MVTMMEGALLLVVEEVVVAVAGRLLLS